MDRELEALLRQRVTTLWMMQRSASIYIHISSGAAAAPHGISEATNTAVNKSTTYRFDYLPRLPIGITYWIILE